MRCQTIEQALDIVEIGKVLWGVRSCVHIISFTTNNTALMSADILYYWSIYFFFFLINNFHTVQINYYKKGFVTYKRSLK